jgi:hypothetical protein
MDRRLISVTTDVSYVNLVAHLIATLVLAVSAATVAWVFLFTPGTGPTTTHAQHSAATQ